MLMSNKADVKQDAKPGLTPKLRFPEFRDGPGWQERQLGPMTKKVGSGITPTGGDKHYKAKGRPFVRSQNIGWGQLILDDVAFIDEEVHSSFDSTEIEVSDVLLNITGASIGRSAIADSRIVGGNVNQHVCIIRVKPSELNPVVLNQYLNSHYGQKQIESFQAGGNRQGLNFAQIRTFSILLPPPGQEGLSEQKRIAECLITLDEVIAAQRQKLDALKTHKKGLMQQLFPREGETQPRLRFPEFQDAEEWDEEKLGNMVEICSGNSPSKYALTTSGAYAFVKVEDLNNCTKYQTYSREYCDDSGDVVPRGVILFPKRGASIELNKIRITASEILIDTNLMALSPAEKVTVEFLFYFLVNVGLAQIADLSTIPQINNKHIIPFKILLPSKLEQERIADCLTSFDDLIAAQGDKLEALKTHKKGLMQQLFPSPEEFEA